MTPEQARKFLLDYYGGAGKYEQALQEAVEDLTERVRALEGKGDLKCDGCRPFDPNPTCPIHGDRS